MSVVDVYLQSYEFNRARTLALLDEIAGMANPDKVLGWRPGVGRAHVAWQLLHIGVTEEIFACERLGALPAKYQELWPRFRGGSAPDENIPSVDQIRQVLTDSRTSLAEVLRGYGDDRLDEVPPALQERGWTLRTTLSVIGWHESHHHGQSHLTLNLVKASSVA